jgi:hypothetical protein
LRNSKPATGLGPGNRPGVNRARGQVDGRHQQPAARAANEKWYPDHAVFNATKDQLKAMPQFKYD